MPTVTTYDQVGKAEDVSDIISNISPTKTPFQSMIGTESIDAITHQWQEDSLAAVAVNAAIEGADAPASTFAATVMRSNGTQIFVKTAKASGTADRVKKYGRDKELSYQLAKKSAEIKRDLEHALVGTGQTLVVGDSSSTARKFDGAQALFVSGSKQTLTGTPTLNETHVLTSAQQAYTNGADPGVLMIKPSDAMNVAAFASATGRTRQLSASEKKIVNSIDVYECPYGDLRVVMNRFQRTTDAFVLDLDMWKRLILRNWFRETLAKTGDATNVMICGEFSLKHKNFLASGLITGLA